MSVQYSLSLVFCSLKPSSFDALNSAPRLPASGHCTGPVAWKPHDTPGKSVEPAVIFTRQHKNYKEYSLHFHILYELMKALNACW